MKSATERWGEMYKMTNKNWQPTKEQLKNIAFKTFKAAAKVPKGR